MSTTRLIAPSFPNSTNPLTASTSLTTRSTPYRRSFGVLPDKTFGDADFAVSATAGSGLGVSFAAAGQCTVSGATVHLTGAGTCAITASQAGGSNYGAAADIQRSFQIARAATATALSSSANPSNVGQTVTFTANVTSAAGTPAGTPAGTVTFKDGGNAIPGCEDKALTSGQVACTTSALSAGDHAISADYSGDANFDASSGPLAGGQTVVGGFEFTHAAYTTAERGAVVVTVRRQGDASQAASVDYSTDDGSTPSVAVPCSDVTGLALDRCDYTRALGTLRFAAGDTQKSFVVLAGDDSYVEGTETARLVLSNPTAGSTLGSRPTATLEIADDAQESGGSPNDDSQGFVRQHYHDFLNREPDPQGLAFWTNEIESCGEDARCREVRRINVSAAFFLSVEFKETGCLVYHFYTAALDRADGLPGHQEFLRDTQAIQRGVIVGEDGWREKLEANRRAFAEGFVSRAEFIALYPLTMAPGEYVEALFAHAGLAPTAAERQAAVEEFGGAAGTSDAAARARALRRVTESRALHERDVNRAFVLMEYFGYLRRDPRAAPDSNLDGYNFWLTKLNQFNGDYIRAEMVKAFISSDEYRRRFGQ